MRRLPPQHTSREHQKLGDNGHSSYGRYHCVKCKGRVSPWLDLSARTDAPVLSAYGEQISLQTLNCYRIHENPDDPRLMAFCLGCGGLVETVRITNEDLRRIYPRTLGVQIGSRAEQARLRRLEDRLRV